MKSAKRIVALLLALLVAFPAMTMLTAVSASADIATGGLTEVVTKVDVVIEHDANSTGTARTTTASVSDDKMTAPNLPSSIKANKPTEFVFKGWWYAGTSKFYQPGDKIPLDNGDLGDKEVLLTAMFESKSSTSTGSTVSSGSRIYGTYKSGIDGVANKEYAYKSGESFTLPDNPFPAKQGYTFKGWSINGNTVKAGESVSADSDFAIYAVWDINDRVVVNSGSSLASSVSSSVPSSVSSSVAPKPSSSSTASKPKPSSSSSVPSSVSSSEEPESSVPEVQEPQEFQPIDLAYSISGDVPITKADFVLKEDIGGTPQLWVTSIDQYSNVDAATAQFVSNGDALAAFDLSLLVDGSAYTGNSVGTVTYALNGTQAGMDSNYKEHVLAMVHVVEQSKFTGTSYYMSEGKKAYLYDTATGAKSEVSNISFVEKDGVSRPVIGDVNTLSSFAYLATSGIIVEAKLIPDANATEASIDVATLSPVMLVQMEIGKASTGAGIPGWVWIVVAVVVVILIALLGFYFYNKSNENKRMAKRQERLENYPEKTARRSEASSSVTGFDE